jgi:2,3-bisphosphoglycerate-independent phosphoglycerate mutase
VLIVRDGWGHNPDPEWNRANAVHLASTPVTDRLNREYPHTLIHASGTEVGLPEGVMGNSEVGHQNIGAGRIVEQEIMRITRRIRDGSFYKQPALTGAFEFARRNGGRVHIMGLCSDGRVHSDLEHLYGLLELSKRRAFPGDRVFVHAFTDGRDTPPHSGVAYMEQVEARCAELGINPVASVVGRYYAMDRDQRWDRVEKAYRMLTHGEGRQYYSAVEALCAYYDAPSGPTQDGDEFVIPSLIPQADGSVAQIRDGDAVIFFNFRGDRPRELCKAFVLHEFPYTGEGLDGQTRGFDRGPRCDVYFATMTAYEEGLPVHVAFGKPGIMENILGSWLADHRLTQFRCAETEKYPHVTFFFNDYRDEPFRGEDWELMPSPRNVSTYDQKPEMSADGVTDIVLRRLAMGRDDVMVINFANCDMVGHTGVLEAAKTAVETVDRCVGLVTEAVRVRGGALIITADHGNCEQMIDPKTGGPHTAHTTNDVDLLLVDDRYRGCALRDGGRLADVAPTLLDMLGIDPPEAMTGSSLIVHEPASRAAADGSRKSRSA